LTGRKASICFSTVFEGARKPEPVSFCATTILADSADFQRDTWGWVYTFCQEDAKMPQVTVYKPNGETLLSTNAKKFEQTKGGIILHLEGEHAKVYGSTMITTLPYVILCGQGC
jgi:hypothetical protein